MKQQENYIFSALTGRIASYFVSGYAGCCHAREIRYLMVLLFLIFRTPLYGEMDATGSGLHRVPGIDETIRVQGVYRVKSSLFKDMTEYRFDLDANSREWHIKSEIIRFPKSITADGNSSPQEKIMPYKSITCGKFNDIYYTAYEINHKYDRKWDIIYTAKKIADYETEGEELNPLAQVFNKQQLNQEEVEENHRIMNQQTGEFKKYHIQKLTGLVEEFTGGDRKKSDYVVVLSPRDPGLIELHNPVFIIKNYYSVNKGRGEGINAFMNRWLWSPETVPPCICPEMLTWRESIASLPRRDEDKNKWFLASFWLDEAGMPDVENPYLNHIMVSNFPVNAYKPFVYGGYKWINIYFEEPQISTIQEFRSHAVFVNADVICLNKQYKIISQSSVEILDINNILVEGE